MELYLDSANLEHIRHAASLGILSGVTTNPSLLAKEDPNVDIKKRILEIYDLVGGHLSVEVISTDTKGMLREAEEILKWFDDATIKIPMIPAGLAAVRKLSDQNIPTNVTLIFSANQAIAAQNAGASYVSIFMGRLDDISVDSNRVLEDVCDIWDVQGYDSEIIAASIRTPIHLTQSALAGAHIATVPYNVLMQSLKHPLTDAGLKSFLDDYSKLQNEINRLKSTKFEHNKPTAPKFENTKVITPRTEIQRTEQTKFEQPVEQAKVEVPKVETPKPEPQKVEQPKVETPKPVPAKVEKPKVEVPKPEPKVEQPKTETPKPKVEQPKTDAPKPNLTKPAPKTNRRGAKKKEQPKA
jgi:transaldolase